MRLDIWACKYEHNKKYLICDSFESVSALVKKQDCLINNLDGIRLFDIAYNSVLKYFARINRIESINVISEDVQIVLLNNLINEKKYDFIPIQSVCEKTISEILNTINIIRSGKIVNNKFGKINDLIKDFEDVLIKEGYFDNILLYKKAIEVLENNDDRENAEYGILDYVNDKLTYLESKLLNALKEGIEIIEIKDKNYNENYKSLSIYGEYNAIEKVIKDIKDKNIPLNDCEIVLTTSAYEASVRSTLESKNIKYSYTSSYSIDDNLGIEFVRDFLNWVVGDYSYKDFIKLINNKDINIIRPLVIKDTDVIYPYQMGIDAGISYGKNRYFEFIEKLSTSSRYEFIKDIYQHKYLKDEMIEDDAIDEFIGFISKALSVVDDNNLFNAKEVLENTVSLFDYYAFKKNEDISLKEALKDVIYALNMMDDTTSFKETSLAILDRINKIKACDILENDSIEVKVLNSVTIFNRGNVYIIGMNYDDFEPKLRDNPIVSNKILEECLDNNYYIKLSLNRSKEKRDILNKSLSTFSGTKVTFIMSNYNTSDFRATTPSPFYNDLINSKKSVEEKMDGKYDNMIYLKEDEVLKYDLSKEYKLKLVEKDYKDGRTVYRLIKPLTASNLNTIMKCPLKYIYSLKYFNEDIEDRNPYSWLNAREKGDLFHFVFEDYCRAIIGVKSSDLSESVDVSRLNKIFEERINYFKERVACPSNQIFEIEREEYYNQMVRYLNMMHEEFKTHHIHVNKVEEVFDEKKVKNKTLSIDCNGEKVNSESKEELIISFKSNTRIDREDYLENDDEIRIVDYKTSRNKYDKKKMDVNLQWFVYPFLEDAQSFEYHFPCVNKEEDVFGDPKKDFESLPLDVGKKLFDFLAKGKIEILENDEDDSDECTHCEYSGICVKKLAIRRGNNHDN